MAEEETIKLRDYQLELYHEIENRKNCILFLPAGSGKTHIAFWLIRAMAKDLKKPVAEGGKRTFFLGNTVQLVEQQAAVLSRMGNFEVQCLTGDSGVDNFDKTQWHSLERDNEVFVMTTQVYLNAVSYGFLLIENANLLIFDECHHATGNHSMAQVLKRVRDCSITKRPKILGLSATLLNANVKKEKSDDFTRKLKELENVFDGEIITSKNCKDIRERHSAKPDEVIKTCTKYAVSPSTLSTLENVRDIGMSVLKVVKLKDNLIFTAEEHNASQLIQLHKPGSNRSKLLRGVLSDILVHVQEYGLYVGYTCCQSYIIELYRFMFISSEPNYINMILYTVNLAQMMRKVLYTSILEQSGRGNEDFETVETIIATSGGKLRFVCDRLRSIKLNDKCIIFVQKKLTAKSLYKIIKIFIQQHPGCEVKVDFIIGGVGNPLRNTREGFHHKKQTKHVLDCFRRGEINVLVATDVLEEGIDIQECNIVIMFDPIRTFRSYIQSKGRARMKGSEYIILSDVSAQSIRSQVFDFNDIDRQLDNVLDQKSITLEDEDDDSPGSIFETYETRIKGVVVTNVSAVPRIYMYCSILPRDLFTDLVPYWFYDKSTLKCTLKLPTNSGINIDIVGAPRPNRKEAKQSAALAGVRLLHELHHLDDHLIPVRIPEELVDTDYWFPNWDLRDAVRLKADATALENTITTNLRVPKYLRNCRPLPHAKCYLHIIRTKTEYQTPTLQRQIFCHELMQYDDYKFGFLTREPLPSICEFPAYSDLGEIRVTIEVNATCLELSEQELEYVSQFHRTLFLDVLRVVPSCFMYDTDGESNGYFVVPLKPNRATGETEISWKCVKKRFEADVVRPTEEEILRQEYSAEKYIAKVVAAWYQPSTRYIVVDFSEELHLNSVFNQMYPTYLDYFHRRYGLTPLRPAQHLLQARPITTNLDGIIPKPISASEKNRRRTKKKYEIYLAPEYCHLFSFPSVYWYKATILPSVLHRIHHLLMAEELRLQIVAEAGVGTAQLPQSNTDTVSSFKKTAARVPQEGGESSNLPRSRKGIRKSREELRSKHEKMDGEMKFKDLDRDSGVSLKEIQQFVRYIETPLAYTSTIKSSVIKAGSAVVASGGVTINFVASPKLMTLKRPAVEYGPEAHQILEALTLQVAADAFHLERLETLGDSLLKYVVSIATFVKCVKMNEGHLSKLKGQLVSNQNLFYCGRKLDIGSYVKSVQFSAHTFWCPPGFTIPPVLKDQFTGDPLSSLLAATIPCHEQFSGNINVATIERMLKTDVAEYIKKLEKKDAALEKQINFYLGRQELRRKNISDVIEALLGLYLKTCGVKGAFKLLKYFGVLSNESWEELLCNIPRPVASSSLSSLERLMPEYRSIEKMCHYQFKNKLYLLHAFTHPSFTGISITDCYQKLEFIGDAILDFLITSYIFEYCGDLTAGQLTDLRSSLVNNNTFGALAVRLQLHKHILLHSRRLLEAVDTFVAYQQSKNYEIHGNELMTLINENDTIVAEEVDVPKALGDVFESLAGAIYLDSGCDLNAVWKVFYCIMQDELEKFSQKIPINPVRALHERVQTIPGGKVIYSEILPTAAASVEQLNSRKKVLLKVVKNKETHEYRGKGDTLKTAKRAAAKFALRELNYNDFVI